MLSKERGNFINVQKFIGDMMTSQFSKIVLYYKHELSETYQRDNNCKMYRIKSRIHTSFHRPYLQKIKLLNLSRTTLQHSTWVKYKKSRTN